MWVCGQNQFALVYVSQGANVDVGFGLELSGRTYVKLGYNSGCGCVDWIYLAQYMVSQGATLDVGMWTGSMCPSIW